MAADKVKVANIALTKIGSKRIIAFSDDLEEAKAVKAVYDDILDEVLTSHPWTFAQKRAALATLAVTLVMEEDDMTEVYAKPADFLKLEMTNDKNAQVKIESYGILSDTTGLKIIYTARVTETIKYSPLFTQALATRLAAEICLSLTQSVTRAAAFLEDYEKLKLPRAKSQDSKQGTPRDIQQDEWLNARNTKEYLNPKTNAETWHPA